ncbi:SLATT domain-containing protein [Mucilaginibacter sp. SP1R1]|uniref:SLATT domain-containing protein n=1 Tax=Mucilaginibacter sp. SP1R1 TaxID=2723091 RepID=UPI00160E5852|nr:SLATT domain-containing protein [Mucilaginibacter sp. SP1R1]MBB6151324.1 hypothetical protein [Mucilaginibacter sp. SP1R1]
MENLELLLKELYTKAYLGKCKNYNAAGRFKKYKNATGLPGILVNITLGSVLFADISKTIPDYIKWIAAFLSFTAALLTGFQTYFNYQKRLEMHDKLGNDFLYIEHEVYKLYQKFKMNKSSVDETLKQYDFFDDKYQQILKKSSGFPTNKKDFESALRSKRIKKENDSLSILK